MYGFFRITKEHGGYRYTWYPNMHINMNRFDQIRHNKKIDSNFKTERFRPLEEKFLV